MIRFLARRLAMVIPAFIGVTLFAMFFAVVIGLPAGVIAGVKRGSVFDHTVLGVSLTGYSMPIFWWGLLLILLFSVHLGWTPVSGRISALYWIDADMAVVAETVQQVAVMYAGQVVEKHPEQ